MAGENDESCVMHIQPEVWSLHYAIMTFRELFYQNRRWLHIQLHLSVM